METFYDTDKQQIIIGVDEAGRGPLFGNVYTSAVILPKETDFDRSILKDSKRSPLKKIKYFKCRDNNIIQSVIIQHMS